MRLCWVVQKKIICVQNYWVLQAWLCISPIVGQHYIQHAHHLFINHTCFSTENFPFFPLASKTKSLRYPGKMNVSPSWAAKDAADKQLMVLEAFVMSWAEDWSVLDTKPALASLSQLQFFSQHYLAVKSSVLRAPTKISRDNINWSHHLEITLPGLSL